MPFDTIKPGLQLCAAGALDASGGAPEWVCIVPLPVGETLNVRVGARDGRQFIVEDAHALIAESNAELARQRGPHPVDKDHQMASWWNPGGPALAWTDKYELRSDGIYAHVEIWLPEGAALIKSGAYRYTSCNVWCDVVNEEKDRWGFTEKYDLAMRRFAGFTITNIPALEVYAMAAREQNMSMKKILERLGLPETAGPEDVLRSVERLTSAGPDLTRYVPRADHEAVVEQLSAARKKLADVEAAQTREQHDALIKEALSAGKITPASEAEWREFLATDGGVERFKKIVAKMPELGGHVEATRKPPPKAREEGSSDLTPAEIHALEVTGQSREQYLKEKASRRAARP